MGSVRVESRCAQCRRPIVAEVDPNSDVRRDRLDPVRLQRRRLERQHFWLIDLIHHRSSGPIQPPGPGVQTGRQNHRLGDPLGGRSHEELVEKPCPRCRVVHHRAHPILEARIDLDQLCGKIVAEVEAPETVTGRLEKQLCVRIADQRVLAVSLRRPPAGHPQRRRTHALVDIPGVVVSSGHRASLRCTSQRLLADASEFDYIS